MFDFKSHLAIVKTVAQEAAKAMHKPSLNNKQAMAAYAKAIGASGKKASFMEEQQAQSMVIDYV